MASLTCRNLCCHTIEQGKQREIFRDISFDVIPEEHNGSTCTIVGLVGPSGTGKTMFLRSLVDQHLALSDEDSPVSITGTIALDGTVIGPVTNRGRRNRVQQFRRTRLYLASHGAEAALSPYLTVEQLLSEAYRLNERRSTAEGVQEAIREMMHELAIEHCRGRYRNTLSGGEAQRVILARALIFAPEILLIDEPTTGLDGYLRAGIRRLLNEYYRTSNWRRKLGLPDRYPLSLLIASHHHDILMDIADRFIVLDRTPVKDDRGATYEVTTVANYGPKELFEPASFNPPAPENQYTRSFFLHEGVTIPPDGPATGNERRPLIEMKDLSVHGVDRPILVGINGTISSCVTIGVLGVSGCGKSTLARAIAGLNLEQLRQPPGIHWVDHSPEGSNSVCWERPSSYSPRTRVNTPHHIQLVTQTPESVYDKRARVHDYIRWLSGLVGQSARPGEMVALFDLADLEKRRVAELSDGQKLRFEMVRAHAFHSEILIADEPFATVDLVTRHKLVTALLGAMEDYAVVYISHDIQLLHSILTNAHNRGRETAIWVMLAGGIVEVLNERELADGNARHPYTMFLLSHAPQSWASTWHTYSSAELEWYRAMVRHPDVDVTPGQKGCPFRFWGCPHYTDTALSETERSRCEEGGITLRPLHSDSSHSVACFHWER